MINKGVSSRRKMIFELVNCFLNAHFPAISLNFKKCFIIPSVLGVHVELAKVKRLHLF